MDLKEALNIMGLTYNSTMEDLKKSYKKLIFKFHPDKNPDSKRKFAEEKTKKLNEARDIIIKYLNEPKKHIKKQITTI